MSRIKFKIILPILLTIILMLSNVSIANSKVETNNSRINNILVVNTENHSDYNSDNDENIKFKIYVNDYSNDGNAEVDAKIGFVSKVANMLFANMILIANYVGGKISTIIGVIIISMFVLDIAKMTLVSQLSQVSLISTLSQHVTRILTLGFVSALLLIPIPNNMQTNGITNLFQYIITKMLNLWLNIGAIFFPDNIYERLVLSSNFVVNTPSGDYIYESGTVLPGNIVSIILGLPFDVINQGIIRMFNLWTFFTGLVFIVVGIYMMFKIIGIVSIFISSVFEFVVLMTLSSLYMPFLLLESTKDRIGSKPLELLLTQGIKLVVTTGLLGMLISLLTTGDLALKDAGIGTIFVIAVAFSIMEKIINNNNQIATTILQGGGLGVSTGNEFFAMATQVGMIAGGAAVAMGNGAIGNISSFKDQLKEGKSFGEAFKTVAGNTSAGKTVRQGKSILDNLKDGIKNHDPNKGLKNSVKEGWYKTKSDFHKINADYYAQKASSPDVIGNLAMALRIMGMVSGSNELISMSYMLDRHFSNDAYNNSYANSMRASETNRDIYESYANTTGSYTNNNTSNFNENTIYNSDNKNSNQNSPFNNSDSETGVV